MSASTRADQVEEQQRRTRRPPSGQRTSEEVRARVLAAAREELKGLGLSVGFESFSMEKIIKTADVSRSTVYRLWPTREDFVVELLADIATDSSNSLIQAGTIRIAEEVIRSRRSDLTSAAGRRRVMREAIREALEHNYYAVIDSLEWQSFLAVTATLLGNNIQDKDRRIERALRDGNTRFIETMAAFYRRVNELLGFQLAPSMDDNYELFAVLASGVVEGIGVRHLANPSVTDNYYVGPHDLPGSPAEWTPAALGFFALFETFIEDIQDFDPSALLAAVEDEKSIWADTSD